MSPIKPENRALYPVDWRAITKRVRERAEDCCECRGECGLDHEPRRCAAPNGVVVLRKPGHERRWSFFVQAADEPRHSVRIVLTVAHLNHQPQNCGMHNLRAMCQLCHNRYDAVHRAATRAATLRAKRANEELPL